MAKDRNAAETRVPRLLGTVAAWCWRLIVIAAVLYGLVWLLARLKIVVLPVVVALLFTALLQPLAVRLRRLGLAPLAATWVTMLLALVTLVGVGTLVGVRANAEFPALVERLQKTATDLQNWLVTGPLQLERAQLDEVAQSFINALQQQREAIASTVLSGATAAVEVFAGFILMLFVLFFMVKDGERIWQWLTRCFGGAEERVDRAGQVAWRTLAHYIQGTVIVAAINAVVLSIVLAIMGIPMWAALGVLIFFSSFVPIVGILVAGGLAVLVTLGAKGLVPALILLGVLVLEQQVENHVLQPQVVGRLVRLHPLVVILAIAVGGVLAGIPGAAFAVPMTAVLYRAWPALRGNEVTA